MHLQNTADALSLVLGAVQHGRTGGQMPGIHPEKAQTAHIGVGHNLKRQSGEGLVVAGLAVFLRLGPGIHALDGGNVHRRGHIVHNRVQQLLHALVAVRRAAGDGNHFDRQGGFADGGADLFGGDFFPFQIRFHDLVVKVGHRFQQLGAVFLGQVLIFGRNLFHPHILSQLIVIDIGVHVHQIDDPLKGIFASDRQLDGYRIGFEPVKNHVQHVEEIRAHDVHLIDVNHAGDSVMVGLTPYGLGLGLDSAFCAHHGDRAVKDTQTPLHLNGEVHVARCVDDIDTMVFPITGSGR
ncbi:hypothetical protein SDC9_128062 [bioreactor metagenome]|uniref:Uncharacterized protein n=1 Tax=bioreactor metagenome TaxID=1076179 RepID=A0A645CVS1_9ZZZZ